MGKFGHVEIAGEPVVIAKKLGISKAGRLSYQGYWEGRPVKIYQTFGPAHARFIKRVSEHGDLRRYFPEVLAVSHDFVVARWIVGRPMAGASIDTLQAIVQFQVSLHTLSPGEEANTPGFDYVDFLEQRLHRRRGLLPLTSNLKRILTRACDQALLLSIEPRLSHPDVTPKNLVLEDGTNQLKSVDNELLTCSPAYLLDLFNTHYALARSGDGVAQSYLERYSHCVRELPLPGGWESLFVALWTLRLAGTHFQARKFRAAYRLADAAVAGKLDNHPVIQAIREIAAK